MANNARNTAKNAVNAAKAATTNKAGQQGRILEEKKPAKVDLSGVSKDDLPKAAQALVGTICEVIGGRKHKDEEVGVYFVSSRPNKFGALLAMVDVDQEIGEPVFIDIKHLQDTGKKMDAKRLKALADDRQASADETLYIACNVRVNVDKKTEEVRSLVFNHSDWFAPISMAPSMVVKTNAETDDGKAIYEVPAWVIRKRAGGAAYDAAIARQDALTDLVNKAG